MVNKREAENTVMSDKEIQEAIDGTPVVYMPPPLSRQTDIRETQAAEVRSITVSQAIKTWPLAFKSGKEECAKTHFKPDWKLTSEEIRRVGEEHFKAGQEAERERVKLYALQAIADEVEYPSNMPDELWQELNGNRDNVQKAMRSTVRLTKNAITERFLQALKEGSDER